MGGLSELPDDGKKVSGLEIKILPDVSEENGWVRLNRPEQYREWADAVVPWAADSSASDTAQGVACVYRLIPNLDTFLESLVVCFPDGPMTAGVWALYVRDELVAVTALRMALRAFADMREETGEGSPASLEIVP